MLLVAETAHFAFDKSAEIADAAIIKVPCDPVTKKVNLVELRKYINWYGRQNVAAIAVSAPSFPHGVMDDVQEAGLIAHQNKIPLHVDACLGGFITLFCEEIVADFRCKGVVSMSIDPHKYGLTGKGLSMLV